MSMSPVGLSPNTIFNHYQKFWKTPMLRNDGSRLMGQGLLLSEGDLHRTKRKLMQPAFHHARIASYADTVVMHTQKMMAGWRTGEVHDLYCDMSELTLGIVCDALFSASLGADANKVGRAISVVVHSFHERIRSIFPEPAWLPTPANRRVKDALRYIDQTVLNIVDRRRESGEDSGDLLSMLLLASDEHGTGQMTAKQARDEAVTLFLAGHETTSTLMSWVCVLLAQHPEVVSKLCWEVDGFLGDRPPTLADLARLPYTEMIIKETLRLYPPSWTIGRQTVEEISLGGYTIPRGSLIFASPYVTQRDSRYFDRPDEFIPD